MTFKIIISFITGALISTINILAIRFIVKNLVTNAKLKYAIFAAVKFALLIFLIFAAIRWGRVDIIWFMAGFGVILIAGILFLFKHARL